MVFSQPAYIQCSIVVCIHHNKHWPVLQNSTFHSARLTDPEFAAHSLFFLPNCRTWKWPVPGIITEHQVPFASNFAVYIYNILHFIKSVYPQHPRKQILLVRLLCAASYMCGHLSFSEHQTGVSNKKKKISSYSFWRSLPCFCWDLLHYTCTIESFWTKPEHHLET